MLTKIHSFKGLSLSILVLLGVIACSGGSGGKNTGGNNGTNTPPVLSSLALSSFDDDSITLARPAFSTLGNPAPAVVAYIGLSGTISASGSVVSGSLEGPVDVSAADCQFTGLTGDTVYTIIVMAKNSEGYSVQQITQSTGSVAPVLRDLVISSSNDDSITLAWPAFSTAGNPAPMVETYIGIDGTMTVSGSIVSGSLQGPIDVSSGGHRFSGLGNNTLYKIIVVAKNSKGYSVQEIIQSTDQVAPVLNNLAISSTDTYSITVAQPTFSTAGNPAPTVWAYIGFDGTITVSGSAVSGFLSGPFDLTGGGKQFTGLSLRTSYKIIVVAQNSKGYSVQEIIQSTDGIPPAMKSLVITSSDSISITLARPAFVTAGNPLPAVEAYIGLDGTMTINGPVVTGSLAGPIDVSSGGYQFGGLSAGTPYKIIVVAHSSEGYSVKQIPGLLLGFIAKRVYGQWGDFSTGSNNIFAACLYGPYNIAMDANGIYIVDSSNNRVLYFEGTSTLPARVYGQGGSFTSSTLNYGGVTSESLNCPTGVIVDSGGVYIADAGNNRVLYYPGTSTTATRVYGQGGSFTTGVQNNGGISADSLYYPFGIALDSGGIYIADYWNHRVLYYSGTSTTATRVYGQGGSFTTGVQNDGGISANSLSYPTGVAVDSGGVYIVDSSNHRVLYYSGTSTTATRVYGQGGSFTTGVQNNGGISASSLYFPKEVAVDSGGVYIVDSSNHRVLYYSGVSTTATRVYGQGGSFITGVQNNGGISADSLYNPFGIAVDSGGVYIVDGSNHRVLYYSGVSTTATRVYGQGGSFATGERNNGGINANTLNDPRVVAVDSGGVYIVDSVNHRVLYYSGTSTTATRVYGQGGSFVTGVQNNGGISADSLYYPFGIAVDTGGIYIADYWNHRVLYYSGTSTTATRVYGQGGSFTTGVQNDGGISANSLSYPTGVAVDSGGVYIVDSVNHRVLYYSGTSTTAIRVYGQGGSFTTGVQNNGGISANSLYRPYKIAVDSGEVYILDNGNNRLLYYSGTSTTATRVYGQGGIFTTQTSNKGGISADSLSGPMGITLDSGGIYIADYWNHRVLYYSGTSTTATRVYGQGGIFTTGVQNNGGISASSLYYPSGVAIDSGGIYIVDSGNNRVLWY